MINTHANGKSASSTWTSKSAWERGGISWPSTGSGLGVQPNPSRCTPRISSVPALVMRDSQRALPRIAMGFGRPSSTSAVRGRLRHQCQRSHTTPAAATTDATVPTAVTASTTPGLYDALAGVR